MLSASQTAYLGSQIYAGEAVERMVQLQGTLYNYIMDDRFQKNPLLS
jgi:hypothetical protein